MEETKKQIEQVKKRLTALHKKIKLTELLYGISVFVILLFALTFVVVFSELAGLNTVVGRTFLFYFWILFAVAGFTLFVFFPLVGIIKKLKEKDYEKLSVLVGEKFSELKDNLLNALQLYKEDGETALKNAAIITNLKKTESVNFNEVISFTPLKKIGRVAFVSVIATVFLFVLFGEMRNSAKRILNYSHEYLIPQKYQFSVYPGNTTVTKGDDVQLKIKVTGKVFRNLLPFLFVIKKTRIIKKYIYLPTQLFLHILLKVLPVLPNIMFPQKMRRAVYLKSR